jgi:hypothetical protein
MGRVEPAAARVCSIASARHSEVHWLLISCSSLHCPERPRSFGGDLHATPPHVYPSRSPALLPDCRPRPNDPVGAACCNQRHGPLLNELAQHHYYI